MHAQAAAFITQADEVSDEIVPLLELIAATGENRAKHIGVIVAALLASITPDERETVMAYLARKSN